jgi:hypothetical protein
MLEDDICVSKDKGVRSNLTISLFQTAHIPPPSSVEVIVYYVKHN